MSTHGEPLTNSITRTHQALPQFKGASAAVSKYDQTLKQMAQHISRLSAIAGTMCAALISVGIYHFVTTDVTGSKLKQIFKNLFRKVKMYICTSVSYILLVFGFDEYCAFFDKNVKRETDSENECILSASSAQDADVAGDAHGNPFDVATIGDGEQNSVLVQENDDTKSNDDTVGFTLLKRTGTKKANTESVVQAVVPFSSDSTEAQEKEPAHDEIRKTKPNVTTKNTGWSMTPLRPKRSALSNFPPRATS